MIFHLCSRLSVFPRIVRIIVSKNPQRITVCIYSAAALLAMQSAVLATEIPSVRLSYASTLSIRMKIGPRSLHREVAKHSSFLIPIKVGGDVSFHLKFALKLSPLKSLTSADFDQYLLITSQP